MEKSKSWLATIEITQIPNLNGKDSISWLCNPFLDSTIYGVNFQIEDDIFSWSFFLNNSTKGDALKNGYRLLAHLKNIFVGMNGKVKVEKKNSYIMNQDIEFYELKLPNLDFDDKISLLNKIITLFKINPGHKINFFILWRRDDAVKQSLKTAGLADVVEVNEEFRIRIFISVEYLYDSTSDLEIQKSEIKGYLEILRDIQNKHGKKAELEYISDGGLLNNELFNEDSRKTYPNVFDFTLPESLPILKPHDEIYGGFEFKKEKNQPRVLLGNLNIDGIKTKRKAYLSLNDFMYHMFVSGLTGAGKTTFLSHLNSEFRRKAKNVGILIFNLEKKEEHVNFDYDIYYKYGDPDFKIPYYFRGEDLEQTLYGVASYIIAAVGLDGIVQINMNNVLEKEVRENGDPPKYIETLFEKLLEWFEIHRYPDEFHYGITEAIKNRIMKIVSHPVLRKTLELPPIHPVWFKAWLNGKTVFLDLSNCDITTKRLLTLAIFQLISVYLPDTRKENVKEKRLKNVIFIDEIGELLKMPVGKVKKDDDYITSYYISAVFSRFLNTFRSREVSLIYAAQRPALLFPNIALLPNIKVLFRTEQTSSRLYTTRPELQDELFFQKNRVATVFDGVNARKFSFVTAKVFRGE